MIFFDVLFERRSQENVSIGLNQSISLPGEYGYLPGDSGVERKDTL